MTVSVNITSAIDDMSYQQCLLLLLGMNLFCNEQFGVDNWKFNEKSTYDLPSHIFFESEEDATFFRLKFDV